MIATYHDLDCDGNALVKASHYGCGAEGCTVCYPYVYRCGWCGAEFDLPIPNDGRPLPCCSDCDLT